MTTKILLLGIITADPIWLYLADLANQVPKLYFFPGAPQDKANTLDFLHSQSEKYCLYAFQIQLRNLNDFRHLKVNAVSLNVKKTSSLEESFN